jgi:hypothetical protein
VELILSIIWYLLLIVVLIAIPCFFSKNLRGLIKWIIKDILKLYRNFLHWNLSKISIWFFGFLMAFAIMVPFLVITFFLFFILNVDWYAYTGHLINGSLTNDMVLHKDFFIWSLLWVINTIIFFIGWNYQKIMYFDLNIKYLHDKKAKYIKSKFFHIPILVDFYKISGWILWILLLPVLFFLITIWILISIFGWVNDAWVALTNGNMFLAAITLLLFIISVVSFIYLAYRLYFSYILLLDKHVVWEDRHSTKYVVKKSFKITKGWKKPIKLLIILFLSLIIIFPFLIIDETLNNTYNDIRNYELFQSTWEKNRLTLQNEDPYYYAELQMKYKDISTEDLQKNIQIYYYLIVFYNIIAFLLIGGLIEMVLVSFYKRELTHK